MIKATILHNPAAGQGETSRQELTQMIVTAGFECSYSSTKENSRENIVSKDTDFIVLAGGDGTVRKIAAELLDRNVLDKKLPIGLLPLGTANNIAKTLGLSGDTPQIIKGWRGATAIKFDVGTISGLPRPNFFLESFGYGLFPMLMKQMKKQKRNDIDDPARKIEVALQLLHQLVRSATARGCHVEIDGKDYAGKFLLIEVMNIRSIGPNLYLAPEADPSDGFFDVVIISENQREALTAYIEKKILGQEVKFDFPVLRARNIRILWNGKHAHVDDEYHKIDKPVKMQIEIREGALDFLVPGNRLKAES
ncbi:MAG: diacylglycerol kinase family protein [Cyclobacteriaceae bacterium]